ncbi:MAG: hypothetical protein AAF533_05470 [Acidobacteriota bacterium]
MFGFSQVSSASIGRCARITGLIVLLGVAAPGVRAQSACTRALQLIEGGCLNVEGCATAISECLAPAVAGKVPERVKKMEQSLLTGVANAGMSDAPETQATQDLGSWLACLLSQPTDGDEQDITCSTNFYQRGSDTVSGQVTLHRAKLDERLRMMLPEADRATVIEMLEQRFDDLDDVTARISWNRESQKSGQKIDNLFEKRKEENGKEVRPVGLGVRLLRVRADRAIRMGYPCRYRAPEDRLSLEEARKKAHEMALEKTPDAEIDAASAAALTVDQMKHWFERVSGEEINDESSTQPASASTQPAGSSNQQECDSSNWEGEPAALVLLGMELIEERLRCEAALVRRSANQRRYGVSVERRFRHELIGEDTTKVGVRVELGLASLNKVSKDAQLDGAHGGALLVGSDSKTTRHQHRFSFELDYTWLDGQSVSLTEPALMFRLEKDSTTSGTLTYGRRFVRRLGAKEALAALAEGKEDVKELSRIDLSAQYVDEGRRSGKQSRFIARLTYTTAVNDSFQLPLSFVYSNRPEYRGEVDKELSVHFGVNYRLGRSGS